MNTTRALAVMFATALVLPLPASAVDAHHEPAAKPARSAPQLTDGEVRRVDKEAKKLTIRHGQIASLDMPPMTMAFQVKEPAMLDKVKVGDKIRFQAERIGGSLTVTHIEATK